MGVHEKQRCMVSQFAQETGATSSCAERTIAFRRGFGRKRFIGNAGKALSSSGSFNMRARAKIPSTVARKDQPVRSHPAREHHAWRIRSKRVQPTQFHKAVR